MEEAEALARLNRVYLKAMQADQLQKLNFIILNDTYQLVSYDRACLFRFSGRTPKLLGVSGQTVINPRGPLGQSLCRAVSAIKNPRKGQYVPVKALEGIEKNKGKKVYWQPLGRNDALWLEDWSGRGFSEEEIKLLEYLTQGYAASLERFIPFWGRSLVTRRKVFASALILCLMMVGIRLPLRVIATCEVVPRDPFVVTTPLEGVVERVLVQPGQPVEKGDLLFRYDKRLPLKALDIARKQLEITEAELERSMTLALDDREQLSQVGVLSLRAEKDRLSYEIAQFQASQLEVMAAINGTVDLQKPEEWRGKAVRVGEKICTIAKPGQTKIVIWIPEDDNIPLNEKAGIKVFLNTDPKVSHAASLSFVALHTEVTEKGVTSFPAEGEWMGDQTPSIAGVKGTAILYGEKVSLFYWLFRRPYLFFRRLLGV